MQPTSQLKNKAQEIVDLINLKKDFKPYSLLPWLRELNHNDINFLDSRDPDGMIISNAIQGGIPSIKIIGYHKDNILTDAEDDFITIQIKFADIPNITIETIYGMLSIITQYDHSGCCNALEFCNISKHGIIAHGDISGIYHS